MNCTRCSTNLGDNLSGWVNCPKCGLAKFIPEAVVEEETKVSDTPEADVQEEKKNQADEPINQD